MFRLLSDSSLVHHLLLILTQSKCDSYFQILGWQGVVPCKTEKMASRLVHIVTDRLLTIEEAFSRMDPSHLAFLLQPIVEMELKKEPYGELTVKLLRPVLPLILAHVLANLQLEIGDVLDLKKVVLEAFVRDKVVLVELFEKVMQYINLQTRTWASVCLKLSNPTTQ